MGKTLVVAEKPSVAEDYARALGGAFEKQDGYLESDRYVVSWAVGHLVTLAEPETYDERLRRWSIKTLPILPERFQLEPDDKGRKQLGVLEKLLKRGDVDDVVNGCDAGREGELIFAYIYDWTGATKPVRRLWVSSMTRDAIREGFQHLRPAAELALLADAARSRSEADWLVGMNATRAATVRARALGGVVSLGRVQTPTLALIVDRDAQIDAFRPETYFHVDAHFGLEGARRYRGRWFFEKEERIADRERAANVAAAASGAPCRVESVKRTDRRERPPLLYDLTSLQREANNRFGLTATRTLAAAQRLYEGSAAGALLTYPRTKSRYLPSDQIPQLKGIAGKLAGYPQYRAAAEYVASLSKLPLARVVDDARVQDHHAIVPTGEIASKALSGDDARVYDLVVRRFLAVFHPDARWEDTEIVTEAGGERFRTRGRRLVEAGWRAAYGELPADAPGGDGAESADDGEEDDPLLPRVGPDERGRCEEAVAQEKQTRPPPRYSEASLLSAMETAGKSIEDDELREAMKEGGLGTPATRAETIEKLIRVGYVERLGRSLRATGKGRQAIGVLGESPLTSAELTGRWEQRLDLIERGQEQRERFMADIRDFAGTVVEYFRGVTSEDVRAQRAVVGPCPNGDGEIRENRLAYGCSSWKSKEEPGCGFVIWKTYKGRSISPGEAADLLEKGRTELLDGFRTRPSKARLVLTDGQVQLVDEAGARLDTPTAEREAIATCPRCGAEIKENSRAYGCSSWKSKSDPGCGFVIWKTISGHDVTPDEARQLVQHGRTDEVDFKERKNAFRGRLVFADDLSVTIERSDGKEHRAPTPRKRAPAPEPAPARPPPRPARAEPTASEPTPRRSSVAVLERPVPPSGDDELPRLLAAEQLEAIDRRPAGGALWVIGGRELADVMDRLAARGFRFTFAEKGGRVSKHRPAWWIK